MFSVQFSDECSGNAESQPKTSPLCSLLRVPTPPLWSQEKFSSPNFPFLAPAAQDGADRMAAGTEPPFLPLSKSGPSPLVRDTLSFGSQATPSVSTGPVPEVRVGKLEVQLPTRELQLHQLLTIKGKKSPICKLTAFAQLGELGKTREDCISGSKCLVCHGTMRHRQ